MTVRFLMLAAGLALTAAACSGDRGADPVPQVEIPFREDGTLSFLRDGEGLRDIAIEIADTDSSRERGLMQRSRLPEEAGMLFIFDREDYNGFWMANTRMSLDILWADADSQIVRIEKYLTPLSPRNEGGDVPSQFVVELEAGRVDSYGIVEGDRIRWTDRRPADG